MSSPPKMDSAKQSAEPISAHNQRDSAGSFGSSSHDRRHQHAMENFKELLVECIITCTPNKSLTPPKKSLVDQRLQENFPRFHTPDHPPYAWMIQSAIKQLNEEGGSNEEAISQFIVREYNDLPWPHSTLLEHHLKKLCESGDLVESHDKYYLLRGSTNLNPISCPCPSFNPGASPIPSPRSSPSPIPCPSPSYSPSPSPYPSPSPSPSPSSSSSSSPSYSNVYGYISSSTSSSDVSFSLKRKRLDMKRRWEQERKRGSQLKRGAKGINALSRCKKFQGRGVGRRRGRGRGCGQPSMENMMEEEIEDCGQRRFRGQGRSRGRGRGRGRSRGRGRGCGQLSTENMMEDEIEEYVHQMGPHKDRKMEKYIEMNVDHIGATETQDVMIEIATAEKNVRPEEQNQGLGNPDLINVQRRAEQNNMVIEIEPHERENRINEERIEPLWQGNLHVQMEETRKNIDQMEATELGELIAEEKLATGEHIQLKKDRVEGTEEQDHSKGMQHEVNEQSKTFQTTEANDMKHLEQQTVLTFE